MAPKRPSPLDEPPAASSSEEEEALSEEDEEESGSGSEAESEEPEPPKAAAPTPVAGKKPQPKKPDSAAAVDSKPQSSSSGSESESGSEAGSEAESDSDLVVKPIASKPMEETPTKTKKPRSKAPASAAATPASRAGSKRPSESELKDSKRSKKKGADQDNVEDGAKKSAGDDSKKLFQRIWSDEDEVTILKGMVDYASKKGADPYTDMSAFHDFIKKSLKADVTRTQLQDKIRRLRKKFEANVAKGKKYNPVKPHDQKVFDLSKKVWGGGEGSSGVSGVSEQSKSNGKARSNQKGRNKALASLKAELLGSPEPPKEAEKAEFGLKPSGSETVGEVIGFETGFRELGLPEGVVKQGLELIGGPKRAELKEKWNKLHVAELELFVRRTDLMRDQARLILEALKSTGH